MCSRNPSVGRLSDGLPLIRFVEDVLVLRIAQRPFAKIEDRLAAPRTTAYPTFRYNPFRPYSTDEVVPI